MRVKWVCRWDAAADKLIMIPIDQHTPAPKVYVHQDSMDAVAHPVTGKLMDSKSAFRRATKAAGCVEVGNDAPTKAREFEAPDVKQDLLRAWEECASRR